jgi:hypothetical protein
MHILLLLAALNWNADLTYLENELPKVHPNAFHATSRETFHSNVESLRARLPELEPHEVVVEMTRLVASIGDGHTRLTIPLDPAAGFFQGHSKTTPPNDSSLMFHALPIRFVILPGGLFTTGGKEVVKIGRMTAQEAIAAVSPIAHRDNDSQLKEIVASYLAVPEILHATGVTAAKDEVPIEYAGGETLVARPGNVAPPPPTTPWSYRVEGSAVIFRYDEVANAKEETLAQFCERMFEFIETHPVDRLVIDVRNNWGGNGFLNRAVIHGLIRSKKLQRPGSVFVLIGRRTFSAAMFLLLDLEKHSNAILIGEPTGGKPTSYGDSRKMILPESGLTVRVSTLYWQADPRDKRDAIAPHVSIAPAIGGDPTLAAALDFFGPSADGGGKWAGTISIEHHRFPFTIEDGKITCPDLDLNAFPIDKTFDLRYGTKRMAGTMTSGGLDFMVVGLLLPQS